MRGFWRGPAVTLGLIALFSLTGGAIFGATVGLALFSAALLALAGYHLVHQRALLKWLQRPDPARVPNGMGRWEDVFADLYRLLKNQRRCRPYRPRVRRLRSRGLARSLRVRYRW